MRHPFALAAIGFATLIAACASTHNETKTNLKAERVPVEAKDPLIFDGLAFALAGDVVLPASDVLVAEPLHNVFRLSDNIITGSEPTGQAGLEAVAELGVRTVVSVDGKAPDVEIAQALGMRYVHIPTQYKGLTDEEIDHLAKTFRELEGPFYVHCFHRRHRGPAGAAIGRIVIDGVPREQAIAEMRQYSGTSKKYEGLYRTVATRNIPTAQETQAMEYDFPGRKLLEGVAGSMVPIARTHDWLEILGELNWQMDPEHPDIDAYNEARMMSEAFAAGPSFADYQDKPEDFRAMWATAMHASAELTEDLRRFNNGDLELGAAAREQFKIVQQSCTDCHSIYRND